MKRNIAIKYLLVLVFFVLHSFSVATSVPEKDFLEKTTELRKNCLLYTSDAADELT